MHRLAQGAALLALLVAAASSAFAQSAAPRDASRVATADSTRGLWITAALGAATNHRLTGDGSIAAVIGVDAQRGHRLVSARWHSLGLGLGSDLEAVSLLVGRATTSRSVGYAGVSAGLTGVQAQTCTAGCGLLSDTGRELAPRQDGVGVMLAGDAALRVGRRYGLSPGLTGYVDVNTVRTFAGIGLEVGLGQWR